MNVDLAHKGGRNLRQEEVSLLGYDRAYNYGQGQERGTRFSEWQVHTFTTKRT